MNHLHPSRRSGEPSAPHTLFRPVVAFLLTAAAWASACASPPPAATAARVERLQCDPGSDEAHLAELLNNGTILEVQPRYSPIATMKNSPGERVGGVQILMRPPEGISPERMTRILQCHSARTLLGQIDRLDPSRDPFSLPNAWVSINVKPKDGNYAVTLEADKIEDNVQLAAIATSFAQAHGVSVGSRE
jgi:hypothetical protein